VPAPFAAPARSRKRIAATQQRNSAGLRDPILISRRCHKSFKETGLALYASSWKPPMWMLLLLPFAGLLWVPLYNFQEPALLGFPFFYWYQLAWVPITSLLIWLVYRKRTPDEAE
jgi:hypothetical protein